LLKELEGKLLQWFDHVKRWGTARIPRRTLELYLKREETYEKTHNKMVQLVTGRQEERKELARNRL
jgi:hypothetical protein